MNALFVITSLNGMRGLAYLSTYFIATNVDGNYGQQKDFSNMRMSNVPAAVILTKKYR